MCCLEGTPSEGMTLSGGRRRRIPFRPRGGLPAVRAREASTAVGVHAGRAELPARARVGRRADRPGPSRRRGRRRRPARGRARREAGRDPAGPLPRRLLSRGRGQPAAGADDRLRLLRPGRAEADHLVDGGAEPRPHGDGDRRPRGAAERARARPAPAGHAEELDAVGGAVGGVPLVLVTNAEPETPYPATLRVLYEREGEATTALDNRATPQAYVLDPTGRVLDRRVPGSLRHVEEMAREQRRRAENGTGAAAEAQPIGRRA